MPRRQHRSALAAVMVDVFQRRHQVGNTSQAEAATDDARPAAIAPLAMFPISQPRYLLRRIPRLGLHARHLSVTAHGAVNRGRTPLERV